MNINIFKQEATDTRGKKYCYEPKEFGQKNYISIKCDEANLYHIIEGEHIKIFSKRKLSLFNDIIKESFNYILKEQPLMTLESMAIWRDRTLLAVLLKDEDKTIAYIIEKRVKEFFYHVFKRDIPKAEHYIFFDKKKDLVKKLEEVKIII